MTVSKANVNFSSVWFIKGFSQSNHR
uniref:Uncharacterized protein n=1 Tax=Rhizophora mucronata TaxID=61149 RepID=A0A2P2Q9S9_RHIMU